MDPFIAQVDEEAVQRLPECLKVCPYDAIIRDDEEKGSGQSTRRSAPAAAPAWPPARATRSSSSALPMRRCKPRSLALLGSRGAGGSGPV